MRFVDDEQRHAMRPQRAEELRLREPFGRDEQHRAASRRDALQRGRLFARRNGAVELIDGDAGIGETLGLVLHQGDERRHDQREPVQMQRGQLVAQRLAGACGHQRERIDAGQHAPDDVLLAFAQALDAEDLAQRALDGWRQRPNPARRGLALRLRLRADLGRHRRRLVFRLGGQGDRAPAHKSNTSLLAFVTAVAVCRLACAVA
jgi:hypothetical protein